MSTLEVKDLHIEVQDGESGAVKEILKGVNLSMSTGEIHAIMGPNGTGSRPCLKPSWGSLPTT